MQLLMVIVRKLFSTKMIALKIWYCVAALFARVNCGSSLELKVCPDSRLTLPCNMTCKTDDFLQTIEFRVNGTLRGSCIGGFGCGAGLQYQGTDTTILTIPSLSYSNDNGNWTCSYSTEVTSAYLTVYGNPSTFNITKTNPDPGAIDVEVVELTARLDCAYPSAPSVILEFRETTKENYQTINSLNQPNSSVPSPGQCGSDTDKIVIANLKASYDYSDHKFAGKTGYLRVKFSYSTVVEFITSEVGPYTFKGCRDPFWYGFLPVFLIVLVSSIICLIILKLESFEKLGGLTKEKIAFIIASIVVAIAVGLGLGFGLRSGDNKCENWILAICLSFLFGVVISIVLYVVIVIRNSKKGYK